MKVMKRQSNVIIAFTFIIISLFVTSCVSAKVKTFDEKVDLLEFPGQTKKQIFDKANKWAVKVFNNADAVIEYSNFETGTISGKYIYNSIDKTGVFDTYPRVKSFITVECKDGRLRLTQQPIEIFHYQTNLYGYVIKNQWESITTVSEKFINFENESENIKSSLQKYISSDNSDW